MFVSDTAVSRKRQGNRDAAVASSSGTSLPSMKPRTGFEPVVSPREPPSVATFPPSVLPAPPVVFDWMRAFALAFRSVAPEPVPPVLPPSVLPPSVTDPVDLTSEVSEVESVTPVQSPVRESGFRVPPVSSLFVSPPHATPSAPLGVDSPRCSG